MPRKARKNDLRPVWRLDGDRRRFAALLRSVMTRRQMTASVLSREAGVTEEAISQYLRGRNLPMVSTATRLADVLMDKTLLDFVIRMRTVNCVVCGQTMVRARHRELLYCSRFCQNLGKKGVGRNVRPDPRMAAIHEMCRACEPEGICRTFDCPLRAFSPLPFVERRAA